MVDRPALVRPNLGNRKGGGKQSSRRASSFDETRRDQLAPLQRKAGRPERWCQYLSPLPLTRLVAREKLIRDVVYGCDLRRRVAHSSQETVHLMAVHCMIPHVLARIEQSVVLIVDNAVCHICNPFLHMESPMFLGKCSHALAEVDQKTPY